jgi:hypothetical protein
MQTGLYHADNQDVPAIKVADGQPDENGDPTDNLVVFSDGSAGSGLDGVDQRRNVKRGTVTGAWTPA